MPQCLANEQSIPADELRMDFWCKGSCKGPYTRTAVSDYNARYNVTLYSFFYQHNNDNRQNGVCNPFVAGAHDFLKAYGCCHGYSIFGFNIVFITLISPGGLLAKKGEHDILREMHNNHTAIYF